jgi:AcrR family transcriptional regulator
MVHMGLMTTPNRQTVRSQNARDNIVKAALTVFALKGYAAASMDDVCMAAGCSKGGLYHHFRTKNAVLHSVVGRLTQTGALLPPFAASDGAASPPGVSLGRVLIDIWAEAARDAELRAQLRAGYEAHLDTDMLTPGGFSLSELLRIGTLIQLLTRGDELDADEAARRLGIEQAA